MFNHRNLPQLLTRAGFEEVGTAGSFSFWYLSLANRFLHLPGRRERGLAFPLVTALTLPFDLAINLFRCHGSMTLAARRLSSRAVYAGS